VSGGGLTDGVYTVVPTPFDASGRLDIESLRGLIGFLVDARVDGLVVLGVMGEAPKLVGGERQAVIDAALGAARGCPVVVGATHPSVAGASALTAAAAASGAAAVMMAPPRLDRAADDDALVGFFAAVADAAEIPIVLQDHPGSTGVQMSAALIGRVASETGRVAALKLEDPPTPLKVTRVREHAPDDFKIFGGLGGVFLLEELRRGANGTMTGFAFPEVLVAIHRAHERGDRDEAATIFDRHLPLIRFEFQEAIGLAIRKRIYRLRGVIADEHMRAPATPLDAGTIDELADLLRRLALLPTAEERQA
jgi:4-hydroxy-tetrahydrodipicolinate synthase